MATETVTEAQKAAYERGQGEIFRKEHQTEVHQSMVSSLQVPDKSQDERPVDCECSGKTVDGKSFASPARTQKRQLDQECQIGNRESRVYLLARKESHI